MYQFFIEESQFFGDKAAILGSDVNHIKNVLRMKQGERVRVSISESGRSFFGTVAVLTDDEVTIAIETEDEAGTELSNPIYLFQGLPKGDKMEQIIQKTVELGVTEIVPVSMKRQFQANPAKLSSVSGEQKGFEPCGAVAVEYHHLCNSLYRGYARFAPG